MGQMAERPLGEVVGSNPGRAIPKALKMVPVATLLDAQHFLSIDTESIKFDHHLRCGGWLNFEFS